ncbi:MAG: hypothetical protein HY543_00325 [Deltaproteobacteria bacterium]|nr:hypothetical protein [Deltaproteobacteria bacterium]
MTAIAQTILFMLAVLAAVAVAAKRLNIAPSILLVVAGIGMANHEAILRDAALRAAPQDEVRTSVIARIL